MTTQGSVPAIVAALRTAGVLVAVPDDAPEHVDGIADDSRRVVRGGLFIAVRGTERDGHQYIAAARAAGAALVLAEDAELAAGGPAILVRDGRRAAPIAAAAYYGEPAAGMTLIAVTGTNGKTTTVGMLRHLFDAGATSRAASIGTLGVLVGSAGTLVDSGGGLTTPGPVDLQRVLRLLVNHGVKVAAIEASSHALAQHRVEGLRFAAAIFTNLTHDHMDYHRTMEDYRNAKLSLAQHLAPGGTAVVNADDPAWNALAADVPRLSFGMGAGADVRATDIVHAPDGTRFRITRAADGASADVRLPLIGDFNVANALGAAAAGLALGLDIADVAARLATMPQVPGRLERVGAHPTVLRDYAHTPDALERALAAVRPFVAGRLIVVFGAGGDRDAGKRRFMGAAAARHADAIIVTSDNPRTEDPERIIDDIVAGIPPGRFERIEDRRAAIARAIAMADPERDVVLLAGKGHEDYQVRGTERLPFDEAKIVAELLRERRAANGRGRAGGTDA
jgi:UDP-N-acetylmuramoyl-L-alanyl-D-glutamate--2,6-diaminopimelate ligase